MIKDTISIVVAIVLFIGLIFGISYFGLQMDGYFAPKYEAIRRKTFEQSQAFNEGMIRDLENLRMDYARADATGKEIIRSTALHRFAAYDADRLPPDLRTFWFQLKNGE